MKLPEAIALMLEGKVMVDDDSVFCRAKMESISGLVCLESRIRKGRWCTVTMFSSDGWREATPEELKEIGL